MTALARQPEFTEQDVPGTAQRTDPQLWDKVKAAVTRGDKGGNPGQWSARKAQLAVAEYKKAGGGYKGKKSADNHLSQWTQEQWDTKSGKESLQTGERYLPKLAREQLTDAEYRRTSDKKRADTGKGKQVSAQPSDIAHKTAHARDTGHAGAPLDSLPVAGLKQLAAERGLAGRSKMNKAQLVAALR